MIAALQDQSFQSQRVRKGYACVMKRFLLLLIATSASSLSCVEQEMGHLGCEDVKLAHRGGIRIHECREQ